MEGSKKFEDAALRGITRHHVWKSRTCDLTVINLRDPSELLGTPEAPPAPPVVAMVAAAEARRQTAPPSPPPPPRPTTGKQESLSALLSKLQLGRPATEAAAHPTAVALPQSSPPTAAAAPAARSPPAAAAARPPSTAAAASLPFATAPSSVPLATAAPPPPPPVVSAPAPSPPVHAAAPHNPIFPDLKESSSSQAGQFEFITGTNIPGQGVVKRTEKLSEASSMALFHDPLWGGSSMLDTFASAPPVKKSPKPQPPRASLSELYSAVPSTFTATPPVATHTPVATPPVASMAPTPMQATLPPQPMAMMGGMMSAPAPQLGASYPMYTMPLQYVAQPQFPANVVYNPAAFFPYGATTVMMPQPQQMPQGYPMPTAAMMRPGTNVKAMPFVPGSTM